MKMIPSAMDAFEQIAGACSGRRVALFLDYDGTLTPIVQRPDQAFLTEIMRSTLRNLAAICPVAIVSGRDRADVENLVRLKPLVYAGSHGFDIAGPGVEGFPPPASEAFIPLLRQAESELREMLEPVQGALVEGKKFAFAVHTRLVPASQMARLGEAVDTVAGRYDRLIRKRGKKVVEFLPRLDWDKGRAVEWLLETLGLDGPQVLPIYLGDDLTDEDAFAALEDRGIGILVAEAPSVTRATYALRDVDEVGRFLGRLTELLGDPREKEQG